MRLFSNEENAAVVVPVTSVEVDLTVSKVMFAVNFLNFIFELFDKTRQVCIQGHG